MTETKRPNAETKRPNPEREPRLARPSAGEPAPALDQKPLLVQPTPDSRPVGEGSYRATPPPTPDAATALGGWPGSAEGPDRRVGPGPNVEAQTAVASLPRESERGVAAGPEQGSAPYPLDPEGKINSGQSRSDSRLGRHGSYRPFEKD